MLDGALFARPSVLAPLLCPPQHTIDDQLAIWTDQHVFSWPPAFQGTPRCSKFTPDVCLLFIQGDESRCVPAVPKVHMVHPCCLYTWVTLACSAVISSAWSNFRLRFLGGHQSLGGGGCTMPPMLHRRGVVLFVVMKHSLAMMGETHKLSHHSHSPP